MIALTQSGFPVLDRYGHPDLDTEANIDGIKFPGGIRRGDVATILLYVAGRFHREVAPLKAGQCWGYAHREIRGGTGWSNHAGGTAIDCNAVQFPQGSRNMTAEQIKACRKIVADCGGIVRWGGDYTAPTLVDQMHFEINDNRATTAALAALAAKIRAGQAAPKPQPLKENTVAALDGDKKLTLTDYRGRFTTGESPQVTQTIETFVGNTWEFTKYAAGRLDQLATELAALKKDLAAIPTATVQPAPSAAAIAAEIIKQLGK